MKHLMENMETTNWILLQSQGQKQFFGLHCLLLNVFMKVDLTDVLRRDSGWTAREAVGAYFDKTVRTLYQYGFFWFKTNK